MNHLWVLHSQGGRLMVFPQTLGLPGAKILAYEHSLITDVKKFYVISNQMKPEKMETTIMLHLIMRNSQQCELTFMYDPIFWAPRHSV